MQSWELDRIYVFLSSGLGHNINVNKKYYYDRSSKVFFNLKSENGALKIWEREGSILLSGAIDELNYKIKKVEAQNPDILEIKRLGKHFDLFPVPKDENSPEFKKRIEVWKSLFDEVDAFLASYQINIEDTRLIE